MKKLFATAMLLGMLSTLWAQQTVITPSLKFGKPSNEELEMKAYAPDTSAVAVVLYKTTDVRYDYVSNDFKIIAEYEVKIKVLKSDGTSYADVSIPYYESEKSGTRKEVISGIEANSYNLEGGKLVREKMKREFVFRERLNKQYMQVKFSIPNVKVGTVLEYKYKMHSEFYYSLDNWEAQQDIPVLYGQYDIIIPEYFQFNLDMRGRDKITHSEKPESVTFTVMSEGQTRQIHCSGRHLTFKGNEIPALHDDDYTWCADDYRAKVSFELGGLAFPGALYESFAHTWDQIDKSLLEDEDFGGLLKMRNPYRDEIAALGIDKLPDVATKASALFLFLQTKMKWNEQYGMYGSEIKKAIKNGTGNNAEFNFVLMSMLREANIPCAPVAMSRRPRGMLPFAHPSVKKLNTFVVAIADSDSTFLYADGSIRTGCLNLLPPSLMVDRARMIIPGKSQWMNLRNLGKNQLRSMVTVSIDAEGKIAGKRSTAYQGQFASEIRNRFRSAKDSTEFVSKLATKEEIKISELKFKNMQAFSPQVVEDFTFEKQAMVNDNLIYINPLIFLHVEKSPFTQAERILPVELPYTQQFTLSITIQIPEGYGIEELPKPLNIKTEDGSGKCRYAPQVDGNKLSLLYTFAYDKLVYLPNEYQGLRGFWEAIVEKNNEMLVLKKL